MCEIFRFFLTLLVHVHGMCIVYVSLGLTGVVLLLLYVTGLWRWIDFTSKLLSLLCG
jgi:hypothetical protein